LGVHEAFQVSKRQYMFNVTLCLTNVINLTVEISLPGISHLCPSGNIGRVVFEESAHLILSALYITDFLLYFYSPNGNDEG
jgi:hypothetical protein